MIQLLCLEDRQPLNNEDAQVLESIAAAVAEEPTASLDLAETYLRQCFPSYKVGHGGSHVWISKEVKEVEEGGFPAGWHRIGMIVVREFMTVDELTARLLRFAGGNEVCVAVAGVVWTVRQVGGWYYVRNTQTGESLKWTSAALVKGYLWGVEKAGGVA